MALPIHQYFEFLTSDVVDSEYASLDQDGYELAFQRAESGSDFFNGINFVEASTSNTTHSYTGWTTSKMGSDHSATADEADKTRGNRIVGFPFVVNRISDLSSRMILKVAHVDNAQVKFLSYDPTDNAIKLQITSASHKFSVGQQLVLNQEITQNSSVSGIGNTTTNLISTIKEYEGVASDISNNVITIKLLESVSDQLALTFIRNISPSNQTIKIVPLGAVINGTEEYNGTPASLGISGWSYFKDDSKMTDGVRAVSQKIDMNFPANADKVKMLILLERDPGFFNESNGFKIIPMAII